MSGIGSTIGSSILTVLGWFLMALGALLITLYVMRVTGMQDAPAQGRDLAGGIASFVFGVAARVLSHRFAKM
ncbi:MAG: hypothetical protein ACRCXM_09765 [Beijerinckiaceae bacterium]